MTPDAQARMEEADARVREGEVEDALAAYQDAYAGYLRAGEPVEAALAAISLSLHYEASLGNTAVADGWLERAERLIADHGIEPLRGWALVVRASRAEPGPAEALALEAAELAEAFGDRDLALCALSELGCALIGTGRVREGLARLGEAVAGTLGGEGESHDTVTYVCCRAIVTCSRAAEIEHVAQWIRAADGFTARRGGSHLHLTCRTHHAGVLIATGRWPQAEQELAAAVEASRRAERVLHAEALARLAELRVAQGRIEEAERLLDGIDDAPAAAVPRAALLLARGEAQAAVAVLERRLRGRAAADPGAAALSELLVEARLAAFDPAGAREQAEALAHAGEQSGSPAMTARGQRALGGVLLSEGEPAAAIEHLDRALDLFATLDRPHEAARTRLRLAEALAPDRAGAAITEARGALAAFERIGAARDADAAAALLRSLGVRAARSGPRGAELLTSREREVLDLLGEGLSNKAIAERLFLSLKTVERHVHNVLLKLDLGNRAEAAAYVARHGRSTS